MRGGIKRSLMEEVFAGAIPLQKRANDIPLITIEYHSVSMIFQQDSVVLSKVI